MMVTQPMLELSSWLRDGSDIYRFQAQHMLKTNFLLENL